MNSCRYQFFPIWIVTAASALLIATVVGCGVEPSELLAQRKQLLVDSRPSGATTIESAKSNIDQSDSVTIEGQVDLDAYSNIAKGKALMLVREIIEDDHGHESGHDASSCPFCKKRLESAPKAVVEIVDGNGKAVPYSVDRLLGVKQGSVVVVSGTAVLDEEHDVLKVTASHVYVAK